MMRGLVLFAGLFLASGSDTASCALHGAEAVDEMLDSALYIMASVVRCDNDQTIRCALDISSAVESVNAMVNVILKAVNKCGSLNTEHADCGLAVGVLTRSMAGLSAASAGIVARCPNKLNGGHALATVGDAMESANRYGTNGGDRAYKTAGFGSQFGQCIINIKDTMKSLFKAIKRIMTVKHNCKHPDSKHCAHNVAKIVASFTALGEYLSGALGKCTVASNPDMSKDALCAQMSLRLIHHVDNVDRAGTNMARHCDLTAAERLYLEDEDGEPIAPATNNSATFALAALLPMTAVLSFVAGKRLAKSRSQPAEDCESLVEVPSVE
jgi:hypothetical protein